MKENCHECVLLHRGYHLPFLPMCRKTEEGQVGELSWELGFTLSSGAPCPCPREHRGAARVKTLAPALDLQQGADRTQRRRARACASSCAAARCASVRCARARTPGRGRERHASFALPRACGKRPAQTVLDPRRTVPLVKRRSHAPSLRAGRASYGMSLAPMLLSFPRSTQSTWDDLGSGMMLAYMLAHLQVAAAQLTEHTSTTNSVPMSCVPRTRFHRTMTERTAGIKYLTFDGLADRPGRKSRRTVMYGK